MINIQEKIDSLIENRCLTLSSKVTLENNLSEANSEKAFIMQYVTNNLDDYGILDLLALIAKEINAWDNTTFSSPNLVGSQESYKDSLVEHLELAISSNSDNSIYLSPTAKEINLNSPWIANNGMSNGNFSSSSIMTFIDILQEELEELRTIRATKNESGFYVNRDYFPSSKRDDLVTIINSIKTTLSTIRINNAIIIEEALDAVSTNIFLSSPSIENDLPNDLDYSSTLTSFETSLNTFISNLNATYDRTSIDTLIGISTSEGSIDSFVTTLSSNVQLRLVTLRNNFNGNTSTGLRKWYLFWLTLLIGKPQSSFISVSGLESAAETNILALETCKSQLNILYGTNTDKYILTPEIATVFKDEENIINILISSLPCFSKYTLYRKEIDKNSVLSNIDYTNVIASNEVSETSLIIQDTTSFENDKLYSYRIKIHDEGSYRIDSYNTGSDQSLVYDNSKVFTIDETKFILTIPEHDFSVGQYIYIENEGIFMIESKTTSTITVDREVSASGILFLTYGIFQS